MSREAVLILSKLILKAMIPMYGGGFSWVCKYVWQIWSACGIVWHIIILINWGRAKTARIAMIISRQRCVDASNNGAEIKVGE